ncbi:hypothetical protein Tco_1081195 [Tanacetum coccineum]|uniref:Reverse transcriptase domain-containing protein n=1 Tax=Tanacetum coccineum TaxID=301880 RepID=A0ABQ5HWW3_9ASTR
MNTASTSGSGTLPGNTITNPKEDLKGITTRSGVAYQGPVIPSSSSKVMNRDTEVTKDTMLPTNNGSTEDVQPPVIQVQSQNPTSKPDVDPVSAPMPNQRTSIPFPSRRNDERRREKANDQIEKFYEIFRDLSFEISFTDALNLYPKICLALITLLGNKENTHNFGSARQNKCQSLIAKDLKDEEKAALIKVLKFTSKPIALELSISRVLIQSFVLTKILMEEDYEPTVQSQRRVNPKIHDVIKKEVEKLLDARLIYPISDSPWETDIREKDEKSSKNGQNRARNGKAWKSQKSTKVKVKVNPKKSTVKAEAGIEEMLNGPTRTHLMGREQLAPKAHLPYGMFLTRLFRHVMEHYPHLDNGIYDVVERVMRPLALRQTRRPRSDRGKARHSVSSSVSSTSAYHNCVSIITPRRRYEEDGASRAVPPPISYPYLNSL